MKTRIAAKYIPLMATALVLIGLYMAGALLYRNFFSARVVVDLFGDNDRCDNQYNRETELNDH